MSGLENSIRLLDILSEAEDKGCPLPTQNIDLNLKNITMGQQTQDTI